MLAQKSLSSAFSLGKLISPFDVDQFFAEVWEKRPLVVNRETARAYETLLSLDDVDRALTTLSLRYPEIRLAKSDQPPKADEYTLSDGRIDVVAVSSFFANGVTIVFDQMQRRLATLGTLCRDMESELGTTFQTNLYLTPPRGGGFKVHYDTHDVFILQIAGAKEWTLFESPIALPMSGQHHDESGTEPGAETHRFTLKAGDIAYIPRGIYHQAHASEALSLHITLGAMIKTWCELMLEAVSEVGLREVALRRALPVGFETGKFDRAEVEKEFRRLAHLMVDQLDFETAARGFAREFARTRHWVLTDQLVQMSEVSGVSGDSIVVARSGGTTLVERFADKVVVYHLNRGIEFPLHAEQSLHSILSGVEIRVADIQGNIDLAGKVALARRLIEEGLLRMIPAGL